MSIVKIVNSADIDNRTVFVQAGPFLSEAAAVKRAQKYFKDKIECFVLFEPENRMSFASWYVAIQR